MRNKYKVIEKQKKNITEAGAGLQQHFYTDICGTIDNRKFNIETSLFHWLYTELKKHLRFNYFPFSFGGTMA